MPDSAFASAGLLSLLIAEVRSVYICDGGHYCAGAQECCEDGCCYPYPHQRPSPPSAPPPYGALDIFVYNHWYFWCVVCAAALLAGCAWGAWRRRARLCGACCEPLARRSRASDRDSAGSCYVPPHYSRCSSFHRAPPPYNEVTSKPDMYPLVITYGDGGGDKADARGAGAASSYLMVHYFRNYIIRPPGSLSAASTAESLNSSFIFNAANEANSVVPPPYSCAGSCEEWRGGGGGGAARGGTPRPALLRSLSSLSGEPGRGPPRSTTAPLRIDDAPPAVIRLDASPDARYTIDDVDFDVLDYDACFVVRGARGPRVGASPPPGRADSPAGSDGGSWRRVRVGRGGSPPRPTSPTDARPAGRPRGRKTSLYMPLAGAGRRCRASPGEPPGRSFAARAFSLSAPCTPCGSGLGPTLLTLSRRTSGSMLSSKSSRLNREESDPLLSECEEPEGRTDGQF